MVRHRGVRHPRLRHPRPADRAVRRPGRADDARHRPRLDGQARDQGPARPRRERQAPWRTCAAGRTSTSTPPTGPSSRPPIAGSWRSAPRTPTASPTSPPTRRGTSPTVVPKDDCLIALLPDWDGRIWFETQDGIVGTVAPDSGEVKTLDLGEEIANSFATDETGGTVRRHDARALPALGRTGRGAEGRLAHGVRPRRREEEGPAQPGQRHDADHHRRRHRGDHRQRRAADERRVLRALVGPRDLHGAGLRERRERHRQLTDLGRRRGDRGEQPRLRQPGQHAARAARPVPASPASTSTAATARSRGRARRPRRRASRRCRSPTGWPTPTRRSPSWWGVSAWYLTAIDVTTGRTVFSVRTGTGVLMNNHHAAMTIAPDGAAWIATSPAWCGCRDRVRGTSRLAGDRPCDTGRHQVAGMRRPARRALDVALVEDPSRSSVGLRRHQPVGAHVEHRVVGLRVVGRAAAEPHVHGVAVGVRLRDELLAHHRDAAEGHRHLERDRALHRQRAAQEVGGEGVASGRQPDLRRQRVEVAQRGVVERRDDHVGATRPCSASSRAGGRCAGRRPRRRRRCP